MKLQKLPDKWIIGPFERLWKRIVFHFSVAAFGALLIQLLMNDLSWESFLKTTCLAIANDFAMTIGHVYIYRNLDFNYDWLRDTVKRLILGITFHTAYSAVIFLIVQLILFNLLFGLNSYETIDWILGNWELPIGVTALVIVFTTTVGFFGKWRTSLIAEEKLRAEMMAYKFESLKSQVNPSFLFDNFNSLKKLIQSDQKKAVNVIQKMSQLYRSVLEHKDLELISLADEMSQVELYVSLLKLRYGNLLQIVADIDPQENERVVPAVVQNTIELCLNGLEKSDATQRTVFLNRSNDRLSVSAQFLEKISEIEVKEEALDILRQRYSFFTNQNIVIALEKQSVSISIPILTEEL